MKNLSGYPYFEMQFTKEGAIFNQQEADTLLATLGEQPITDLLVVSHGWNNDMNDARNLYKNLIGVIADQQKKLGLSAFRFGVLGVLWPSKKFADNELIAGGAAGFTNAGDKDLLVLQRQLQELTGFFDKKSADKILQKAKTAAKNMAHNADARKQFVQHMNELISSAIVSNKQKADEDGIKSFAEADPQVLLVKLEDDWATEMKQSSGGAADTSRPVKIDGDGGAAGIGSALSDIFSGARNLLNFVTYYQMKERAGTIGIKGLHPLLLQIRSKFPKIRLHLIGHSFGGRLVTAAIAGPDENATLQVDTLHLLQAAFSHFGFAQNYDGAKNGFFRRVVSKKKVIGPTIISYTHNDKAVGVAYAIASMIAKQVGSALGDKNDFYGGMGGNGARATPEANNDFSISEKSVYAMKKGTLYNLNADSCIQGHSDICKGEVARAILSAVNYKP